MLTPREQEALDRDGYLVLAEVVDARLLTELRAGFEAAAAGTPGGETGTRHIPDLRGADPAFARVVESPRVWAAVTRILGGPARLDRIHGRDPLPGYGQQGLHSDWGPRATSRPYLVATVIWLLDDFTPESGATRVVPGTHQLIRPPVKEQAAPAAHHPEEVVVRAAAGSALVMNGHLWHAGTRNQSTGPRRVLQATFLPERPSQ